MSRIFVGNITSEGDRLLHTYLDKFMPDAVIEPLRAAGIKGKIKNTAKRPDVALVIIDEVLYNNCVGIADDVLSLPKVHKYVDDIGLRNFLITMFGIIDEDGGIPEPSEADVALDTDMDFSSGVGITNYETSTDGLELQKLREKLSQAELLVSNLTKQLEDSGNDSDVSALVSRIADLEKELQQKDSQISELENKSYSDIGKITQAEKSLSELKVIKDKLHKYEEQLATIEHQRKKLESDLEVANSSIDELKGYKLQADSYKSERDSFSAECKKLNALYSGKCDEFTALKEEKDKLNTDIISKSDELKDLQDKIISIQKHATDLESQLSEVQSSLDVSEKRVVVLEQENKTLNEGVADLEELRSKADKLDSVKELLESKSEEVLNLQKRLQDITVSVKDLDLSRKEVENLSSEIEKMKGVISEKDNEIKSLRDSGTEIKSENLSLSNLIKEKERQIEVLESDIESLKKANKDGNSSELRLKIADLQEEIEQLKSSKDESDSNEVLSLRDKVVFLEDELSTLRLDLLDKDEQYNEIMNTVFIQMMNCAMPKAVLDTNLVMPNSLSNAHVIVGGSSESNLYLYKVLKNTCVLNPDKRMVIFDLVTDSYIDSEFKIKRVFTPINWLMGTESVGNFVADTCFGNVKVVSTALAYMNPLYLLSVDWSKRLTELEGLADILIFNVGSLENVVARILFQAFSQVMGSHIVLRATPINLRTALLSLAGIKGVSNTEIACVNYENASRVMYEKLSKKYTTRVLQNSEGIDIT